VLLHTEQNDAKNLLCEPQELAVFD